MGIAVGQQDIVRVYPLPDDPERCLEDFLLIAAEHARELAEQIGRQETSVQRFLELSGEDFPQTGGAGWHPVRRMRRKRILIIAGFGVFVFLGISLMLARALSATGTERSRVLELARGAGARGRRAVLARHPGVRPPARLRGRHRDLRGQAQAPGPGRDPAVPPERSSCR